MSKSPCPRAGEGCALPKPFGDEHHLAYPANQYRTGAEKGWREQPFNKVQICRCLHNAIHASGYVPEKPSRAEMVEEIWNGEATERSQAELDRQLAIGRAMLDGCVPDEAA